MNTKSLLNWQLSKMLVASLLFFAFDFENVSAFNCPGSKTPPLVVKGKRFYDSSTEKYVPIKGIAYYPRPNDGPLSKGNSVDFYTNEFASRWREDIANMRNLGVNAIRLYAVDPSANHDAFMCDLQEAGIYVMLGLLADCEDCGIGARVGVNAEPPLCYTSTVKDRGRFVIRSFSRYDNLMAFSAGNEASIYADDGAGGPREANVPCQKKFLRDMREYASGCLSSGDNAVLRRAVPIGLVNWDGSAQSFDQHLYFHCRTDPEDLLENAQWFALNSYRHCDGFATSLDEIIGWPELQAEFKEANLPGPVLFGEYGCREQGFPTMDGFEAQRTWFQTEALYTPDYSDVFAGGFVFEYSAEKEVVDVNLQFMANKFNNGVTESDFPYQSFARANYGVGYFGPFDCQHDDESGDGTITPCTYTKYPEWDGLLNAYAKSDSQNIRTQSPGAIPMCPERFQPLSFYDWPTDDEDDPELEYCLELKMNEDLATDAPTTIASLTSTATRAPTAARNDDSNTAATDAPTIPTSESIVAIVSSLPPTAIATAASFVPTILTRQDITTITSTLSPTLSATMSSTLSPTLSPPLASTMPPTTISPPTLPTTLPTSLSTLSPTAKTTEVQTAQCSFHPKCYAQNLAGFCCPTLDGVALGCCGDFWEDAEKDGSELESSARGVIYHYLLTISVLAVLFGCW